jgi:hypothetical protein
MIDQNTPLFFPGSTPEPGNNAASPTANLDRVARPVNSAVSRVIGETAKPGRSGNGRDQEDEGQERVVGVLEAPIPESFSLLGKKVEYSSIERYG